MCRSRRACGGWGDVNGVLRLWRERLCSAIRRTSPVCAIWQTCCWVRCTVTSLPLRRRTTPQNVRYCVSAFCATAPTLKSAVRFLQTAVYLYANRNAPVADEQKAEAYAKMLPSLYCSRELLLADAYTTEEGREKALVTRHCLTLDLTDLLCRNLPHLRREDVSTENDILAQETALKVWNAVICDGNFLFYHCRIADIYRQLACDYAALGGREERSLHTVGLRARRRV